MVFWGPVCYGNFWGQALVLQCMVFNGVLGCSCTSAVIIRLDVVVIIVISPIVVNLLWTLFMAQGGYLHLTRASLRCASSFWSSSGLVQTVLALWVSVSMTPYLVYKLWWLSHCKYWSVWVGLWYTVNDRELSASGVTKVSRKGMPPFPWVPSTVNVIAGSMLLICSRNSCLWVLCWVTHVSSTNLNQNLGGLEADQRASLSKCSMYRLATMGLIWWPHCHSLNLLIEFILKWEVCIMQTEPQEIYDVLYW